MSFEHPDIFSGETVVSTPNLDLVLKDTLNLKDALNGDEIVGLSSMDPEDAIFGGAAVFFPATADNLPMIYADLRYMPYRSEDASLADRSLIHATILQEGIVEVYDVTGFTDEDGSPGLSVSLTESGIRASMVVSTTQGLSRYTAGELKISLDLPEAIDDESREELVRKTLLLWGAAKRGLQIGKQSAPARATRIVVQNQNHEQVSQLLDIANEYIDRYDDSETEMLPRLAFGADELDALVDAYHPSADEFNSALNSLVIGYQAQREALIDTHDSDKITIARIAGLLEATKHRR